MLAWGFEAEAERLIRLRDERRGARERMPVNSGSCAQLLEEFKYDDQQIDVSSDSSNWLVVENKSALHPLPPDASTRRLDPTTPTNGYSTDIH